MERHGKGLAHSTLSLLHTNPRQHSKLALYISASRVLRCPAFHKWVSSWLAYRDTFFILRWKHCRSRRAFLESPQQDSKLSESVPKTSQFPQSCLGSASGSLISSSTRAYFGKDSPGRPPVGAGWDLGKPTVGWYHRVIFSTLAFCSEVLDVVTTDKDCLRWERVASNSADPHQRY